MTNTAGLVMTNLNGKQNNMNALKTKGIFTSLMMIMLMACTDQLDGKPPAPAEISDKAPKIQMNVYKSPSCDCCNKWVDHLGENGFSSTLHHPQNLEKFKLDRGITPRYQSCHTAVSENGYVFEGHIPAEVMKRFLLEKPAGAIGLSVPGMPVGSPGMEMGERRDDYNVLLLMKDGTAQVYHKVRHAR